MHLSATLAMFTTITPLFLLTHAAGGAFSASCDNIRLLQDHILSASCGDGRGGATSSLLDLNACVGFISRRLICRANGNYATIGCYHCIVKGSRMTCDCPDPLTNAVAINLDDCVVNRFGVLACN
ncbi:hypothetical protein BJ165DRAFT_1593562 [Panaeolus papilionaceus]|nr:hypothetical protein BJ165DRAFT_1593562 [Panaeolus papilionaceus]